MIQVDFFTFNAFQENTYIISDPDTHECIIIDPGCSDANEQKRLSTFIKSKNLTPIRLINTHCHIDHVLGNKYVAETYDLPLEAHEGEISTLASCLRVSQMYGLPYDPSPEISSYLSAGDTVTCGGVSLEVRYTPGHSPASICLVDHESRQVIGGDVLFRGSIGRTDLPGGSYQTLITSIQEQLLTLEDDYVVYSGHGGSTTIGYERQYNPFLQE